MSCRKTIGPGPLSDPGSRLRLQGMPPPRRCPPPRALQRDLRTLAACIETVAGDLAAHAPANDAGRIAARLQRWRREVEALARALRARRARALGAQLKALGLSTRSCGLKLHLGAADASLPGWVNVDRWPAELSMDLRWGLPFRDGAAGLVYLR